MTYFDGHMKTICIYKKKIKNHNQIGDKREIRMSKIPPHWRTKYTQIGVEFEFHQ